MKVLFISKELRLTSGSGVGARMHRDVLENIVGKDNLFVVDMAPEGERIQRNNYIAFGKYSSKIERIKRNLQGNIYLFSNRIIKEICEIIQKEKINFVFVDDSTFGKMVKAIKKKAPSVPVVSFYHDVKAELYSQWSKQGRIVDKIEYAIALRNEKLNVKNCDKNIVLNLTEDEFLYKHYKKKPDYYLPVCVPQDKIENASNPYKDIQKRHILFVGTSYYPNIQGVKWFYLEVYPGISSQFDFTIVGKGLNCLQQYFERDSSVTVKGKVDSLTSYYRYADVVIAPLTNGGGMKIKTAEAFSFGKFFVGSPESLRGYWEELPDDLQNNLVYNCETKEEYVTAFENIFTKDRTTCNEALIKIWEEKYSFSAAKRIMGKIIRETLHEETV